MTSRVAFAYVVKVEGMGVTLNLHDRHRGQVVAHEDGVTPVTEIGSFFGIACGDRMIIARVRSLQFAEAREAHASGVGSSSPTREPLRFLEASVVGALVRRDDARDFSSGGGITPPLGAEAYVLNEREMTGLLGGSASEDRVELGREARSNTSAYCDIDKLLTRHVAVLGSTGQGKSCFTAAVLQQLALRPGARIVIFDVNGEYADALQGIGARLKTTKLGRGGTKIPYFALGHGGLFRLLNPSEKTQAPALSFAWEQLRKVQSGAGFSAGLVGDKKPRFFDDCREFGVADALSGIEDLRKGSAQNATMWPHMGALSALVAESYCLRKNKRDDFAYGSIAPLVTRIRRCVDDPRFTDVVDVTGGSGCGAQPLDHRLEAERLSDDFFGGTAPTSWAVHVVDLHELAHDLMPTLLGALLELLATRLFERGQRDAYPTLLVLEEAHHYLRTKDPTENAHTSVAYERLAKEGRKFGLNLWVSTQRPSELSPTVLGQCGTWVVFRLTSEQDRNAVLYAGEWSDRRELDRIAGLPRQEAIVFGAGVPVPVRIIAKTANPTPRSQDVSFRQWTSGTA